MKFILKSVIMVAVVMAGILVLALKPAPVQAAPGVYDWVASDRGGTNTFTFPNLTRHEAKSFCGGTVFDSKVPGGYFIAVSMVKVGTSRNICTNIH